MSALRRAGVKRVVDVRALPLSPKKGFSKTKAGLREIGLPEDVSVKRGAG